MPLQVVTFMIMYYHKVFIRYGFLATTKPPANPTTALSPLTVGNFSRSLSFLIFVAIDDFFHFLSFSTTYAAIVLLTVSVSPLQEHVRV